MASRETAAEVLHAHYEFSLTCLPVQWEQNIRFSEWIPAHMFSIRLFTEQAG